MNVETQIKKSNFREDINGLRAIAVIAVVFFHFLPEVIPGGFVGVDVFFVISGYLMTSIIFRGLDSQNFSYLKFIINRAKRIVPALLVVSVLLLIAGYITLRPSPYKVLTEHVRDSLLFISNITYEQESGYFDSASITKFLLHTWSLSVEWQFYFIYPIALLFFRKFLSTNKLKVVVLGLLIVSIASSVFLTKTNPEKAYFMFYTRAWEMLFGGLAFLYPLTRCSERGRFLLELVGLSIIVYSIFLFEPTTPWPGYAALLPVFGTYLCIVANNRGTILSGFLINKIGLWSYSIYLVHWPIITFNHTLEWGLTLKEYLAIVVVLSILLYELVEKRRNYSWGLLAAFAASLLTSSYIIFTNGIESRAEIPEKSRNSLSKGQVVWQGNQWILYNNRPGDENNVDYIFYGDSFNAQYSSYIDEQKKTVASLYNSECLSTPNLYSRYDECGGLYQKLVAGAKDNPSNTLVMAQSWEWASKDLRSKKDGSKIQYSKEEFISILELELQQMKNELDVANIVIIGTNNHFVKGTPKDCLEQKFASTIYEDFFIKKECLDVAPHMLAVDSFNQKLKAMTERHKWLHFIDPNDALCSEGQCIQIENDKSIYSDNAHFSIYGSKRVGEFIFDRLEQITAR